MLEQIDATPAELIGAWRMALTASDAARAADALVQLMGRGYGVVDDAIRGPRVVKIVPCVMSATPASTAGREE